MTVISFLLIIPVPSFGYLPGPPPNMLLSLLLSVSSCQLVHIPPSPLAARLALLSIWTSLTALSWYPLSASSLFPGPPVCDAILDLYPYRDALFRPYWSPVELMPVVNTCCHNGRRAGMDTQIIVSASSLLVHITESAVATIANPLACGEEHLPTLAEMLQDNLQR